MFSEADYVELHRLVFRDDYPGYKPNVVEIPNGDGKADADKRYAHVALKYMSPASRPDRELLPYLRAAHLRAVAIAAALGLPTKYMPRLQYGALRVLEYPPGAISNEHEDFDLFTLMCYRDQPDRFVSRDVPSDSSAISLIRHFNAQAHLGQLGTEIGLGPATPHSVMASGSPQRSIVYFAIPDHDSVLPSGVTVRDWLNERMSRSRTSFEAYA